MPLDVTYTTEERMKILTIMFDKYVKKYGLGKHKLKFKDFNGTLGMYDYNKLIVYISNEVVEDYAFIEAVETLKHEICHALACRDDRYISGHGKTFRKYCREFKIWERPYSKHCIFRIRMSGYRKHMLKYNGFEGCNFRIYY